MEKPKYRVYDFDSVDHGHKLEVEHSFYLENPDISELVSLSMANLRQMQEESVGKEDAAFKAVLAAVKQWEEQAASTQVIEQALDYLRVPEVIHTSNQWEENSWQNGEVISNRVYCMSYNFYEQTKYDRETKQSVPVAWYVSWDVYLNSPKQGCREHIAGQERKRFTDKAAAMKYLEGRKKAYAHLFTEISPLIPAEYAENFKVNGQLLPGYTLENSEGR